MRNPKMMLCLLCCFILLASSAVQARSGSLRGQPRQYLPANDGLLVQVTNPVDGKVWSVWSYHNGGEFDLAIASDSAGIDGRLHMVGLDDGNSQVEPALTTDPAGNLYMAYIERLENLDNRLVVSSLRLNRSSWSTPTILTLPSTEIATPTLEVIGEKLVVAFRSADGVDIIQLQLLSQLNQGHFTDGPDPITERWPMDPPDLVEADDCYEADIDDPIQNTVFGPAGQSSDEGNCQGA